MCGPIPQPRARIALRGGAASLAQMVVSDADSMKFNDLGDSPQNTLVQFGSFVTPSLQGDVECFYQFSDLVKESLCDAATRFSAMLAALGLVLPSCVWHYPCCFQLVFMLLAAFVAFPGFLFLGVENMFEDKPRAGLGCVFSKGKDSTKFPWKFGDKVDTFSPSQVRDAGIQAVASDDANDGFFCVFESSCAAAALASAFEYLFVLVADISAAAFYEGTLGPMRKHGVQGWREDL